MLREYHKNIKDSCKKLVEEEKKLYLKIKTDKVSSSLKFDKVPCKILIKKKETFLG